MYRIRIRNRLHHRFRGQNIVIESWVCLWFSPCYWLVISSHASPEHTCMSAVSWPSAVAFVYLSATLNRRHKALCPHLSGLLLLRSAWCFRALIPIWVCSVSYGGECFFPGAGVCPLQCYVSLAGNFSSFLLEICGDDGWLPLNAQTPKQQKAFEFYVIVEVFSRLCLKGVLE